MRYISKRNKPAQPIPAAREIVSQSLSTDIDVNIQFLKALLNKCSDAVIREFTFGTDYQVKGALLYFDGLVDKAEIENHILKTLLMELNMLNDETPLAAGNLLQFVQERILTLSELKPITTLEEVTHYMSLGDSIILIDGYAQGLSAGTRSWPTRGIETPVNESVIQGPKEGFNEVLRDNTALLRRRIKSSQFKIETMVLGRITKTDIAIAYIEDIASPDIVKDINQRLAGIDLDSILDTGYLEEFVSDQKYTIFSQVEYTEKPDRVCGMLLEGKVCIMVDGSPMAMVLPTSFPQLLNASEDYYQHFIAGSIYRILRFFAFLIALFLPSFYVAIISFHQEMLPTSLYLTVASSREGIPFPIIIEALLMEVTFELLREAGLRLPQVIGPAVSIVGALIIGDAAVRAGLVSSLMVVVVAFTGIASFVIPVYNGSVLIRITRFGILIAAGILGLPGIIMAILLILIKMVSIKNLGQPYLEPVSPFNLRELTDIIVRRPWSANMQRPNIKGMTNKTRQTIINGGS
jgi:hypothetical protein